MKTRTALRGLVYMGLWLTLTLPVLSAKTSAEGSIPQTAENRQALHHRLQEAVNELNLSDDQKGKVKEIFDEAKVKREAILKDTSLTDDQKKEKMKGLRVDTKAKVNEVLAPERRTP